MVTCTKCGHNFLEGLERCPECRTVNLLTALHEEVPPQARQRRGRYARTSAPRKDQSSPPREEILLSWESAWRIAIATVVVAVVTSAIGWLVFALWIRSKIE